MIESFLSALALVFVLEGLMPFAFPEKWRRLLQQIIAKDERTLRLIGLVSMIFGMLLLTLVHHTID